MPWPCDTPCAPPATTIRAFLHRRGAGGRSSNPAETSSTRYSAQRTPLNSEAVAQPRAGTGRPANHANLNRAPRCLGSPRIHRHGLDPPVGDLLFGAVGVPPGLHLILDRQGLGTVVQTRDRADGREADPRCHHASNGCCRVFSMNPAKQMQRSSVRSWRLNPAERIVYSGFIPGLATRPPTT